MVVLRYVKSHYLLAIDERVGEYTSIALKCGQMI